MRLPPRVSPRVPAHLPRRLALQATLALAAALSLTLQAAPLPYNESADAKAELQGALQAAKAGGKSVLVIFGANWCEDCRALDTALKAPQTAQLMSKEFVVLKVDVGRFDRNTDLSGAYGNPTKKGIPAAVVLSADNQVLYATRAGELADARRMSETGVYDFFRQAAAGLRPAR